MRIKYFLFFIAGLFYLTASAQQYGPKAVKKFESKVIKSKTLMIPSYEMMISLLKKDAFNEFESDNKKETEYKRRWEEALKSSSWDFTDYKIGKFYVEKLKRDKDKSAIVLVFDKDFYQNLYAHLAVTEPKYKIIATAPVNGLDLSSEKDIRLMINMLTFSMMEAGKFNDPQIKDFYKGHVFIYKKSVRTFNDGIGKRLFLVPMYGKDKQNFGKINEKLSSFLKEKWTITESELVYQSELENRSTAENFEGYYLVSIPIYTSNEFMPLNYFVAISYDHHVLFMLMGDKELTPAILSKLQLKLKNWLPTFNPPGTPVKTISSGKKEENKKEEKKKDNKKTK